MHCNNCLYYYSQWHYLGLNLSIEDLPGPLNFNMANLTTYFITRLVSDFKNLNRKAYPLFKDGHACASNQGMYQRTTMLYMHTWNEENTAVSHKSNYRERIRGHQPCWMCWTPWAQVAAVSCSWVCSWGICTNYMHSWPVCLYLTVTNLEPAKKEAAEVSSIAWVCEARTWERKKIDEVQILRSSSTWLRQYKCSWRVKVSYRSQSNSSLFFHPCTE